MFHRKRQDPAHTICSLIARGTAIRGSVAFTGALYLEGELEGPLSSDDAGAVLTVGEDGGLHGDIRVPTAIIHGHVRGDIHATDRLELSAKARVTGNIYYTTLVMAAGAQVQGQMHHGAPLAVADALPQQPAEPEPDRESLVDAATGAAPSAEPVESRRERRRRHARRGTD